LNSAGASGGGIATTASQGDFLGTGLGSVFSGNSAGGAGGGVFRSYRGAIPDVGARVTNVPFAANTAGSVGGAIFSAYFGTNAGGSASLVLMNDTLNLNAAGSGSAIFALNTSGKASTVTITNTAVASGPAGSGPNFSASGAGVTFNTKAAG